ncbi:MAG TPA: hypothetical protein VHS07_04505 [Candidatus Binataceae bacterium]|nr:hypothetical protein [Candidatus Binataceae bacterium]
MMLIERIVTRSLGAAAIIALAVLPARAGEHGSPKRRVYTSPDRQMRAVVLGVAPRPGAPRIESKVEIDRADHTPANTVDYSSPDGSHGYRVIKAHWTPDSQFFVYSMASSGGHQPWHSPIYFYSRKINKTQGIEQTLGKPVLDADFTLEAPATVTITTWVKPPLDSDTEIMEDVKLDELAFTPANQPLQPRTLATPAP